MKGLYPNIKIALRIFVSTSATNCTAEHQFPILKRMKNYLRLTTYVARETKFLGHNNQTIESRGGSRIWSRGGFLPKYIHINVNTFYFYLMIILQNDHQLSGVIHNIFNSSFAYLM